MRIHGTALVYLAVTFISLCVGSFLNVVIYRLPRGLDFVNGRSRCPGCDHILGAADLVPVVSYLALAGRCRYCRQRISPRYVLVEALCALLGVGCLALVGHALQALAVFAAGAVLIAIAFIDWDTMEIPNGLVITLVAPAAAMAFIMPQTGIWARVAGMLCISLPMAAMNLLIKDSFGGGDIKLMAVCGFMLGWRLCLFAGFAALLTGGAYGVYLLLTGKKGRKDHFAFGPFLAFGAVCAMLFGEWAIGAYLGLFMP